MEGDSPAPVSACGRSKLAGELAAARYDTKLSIRVVRPSIVFGPGDRGVLETYRPIAHAGLQGVPGWEERRVSLIHVADLAALLLLAVEKSERLQSNGAPGQDVCFVAAEHDPTYAALGQAMALEKKRATVVNMPGLLVRLVELCCDALGRVRQRPGWVNSDKMAETLAGSWTCSSAKARTQSGWSPAATLAERLRETAQWYRQAGWL